MSLTEERDARGVVRLTLDRPDRRNALDAELMDGLAEAAHRLARDRSARVVVLAGCGDTFCAGGDLGWMREQVEGDAAARARESGRIAGMLAGLAALPQPLVAEVAGNAFGGGVGLVAVCDVAVAARDVRFALSETRLGLIPATIGPYLLARIGPRGGARRAILSGQAFGAEEALAMGLLARLAEPEDLASAVEEEVSALLACAPGALAEAKALLAALGAGVSPEAAERSRSALAVRWESEEARDGISAFFARRPPPWAT